MRLGTNGLVVNQFGQILLIRRDDSRTFAPPGGGVEAGELPTENVVREVEEETGLKVVPVRLVGVYHFPWGKEGALGFSFRCLQQGGELITSPESPQVGFFPGNDLPGPMAPMHRERLEQGLNHAGGPPYWGTQNFGAGMRVGKFLLEQVVYRWKDWRRKRNGEPAFTPPPSWKMGAFTVIQDDNGAVLWVKRTDHDIWNLPGGGSKLGEPPWETAVRETREETGLTVTLTDLTGVYVYENKPEMVFTFTAQVESGRLKTGAEAAGFAYFLAGAEPAKAMPQHVERVADSLGGHEGTVFKRQDGRTAAEFAQDF